MRRLPARRGIALGIAALALSMAVYVQLAQGPQAFGFAQIVAAITNFDDASFDHHVIASQRLPRVLISVFVGALMACAGAVLQGVLRNPLASPSIMGISSGASLFVVAASAFFQVPPPWQGLWAAAGGCCGFAGTLAVARIAGGSMPMRGPGLVLAGAIVSMAMTAACHALLLMDPALRTRYLAWIMGDINHAYVDHLRLFWPMGLAGLAGLLAMSRPLTLMTLGADKAASAGVDVARTGRVAAVLVAVSASAAVAVCGPIGFVGLAVPHMVRPFTGPVFSRLLPMCALVGALACVLADLLARMAFAPRVVATGVVMDIFGGIVFVAVVRRFYLRFAGP